MACAPWPAPHRCGRHVQPSGITLTSPWPPNNLTTATFYSNPPQRTRPPPYLKSPPRTVCLGVGRQLFIDNYLIDSRRTTLRKSWHEATVLRLDAITPDRAWEVGGGARRTARPFGGASLLDPRDQTVRLFYRCGWRGTTGKTCVALSKDGLRFTKPDLSKGARIEKGLRSDHSHSNVVLESKFVEAFEVAYDFLATPPRYWALRMEYMTHGTRVLPYVPYESSDGLHWRKQRNETARLVMADRSTFFLNPLRDPPVWVFSLRENLCEGGPSGHMRARRYWERPHGRPFDMRAYAPFVKKYFQCESWRAGEPVPWFAIDRHDCGARECDVYNVDGIAYESILIHGLAILNGPYHGGELKNNSAHLGFSRDGFHMVRPPPPRRAFIRLPDATQELGGGRGRGGGPLMGISNVQLASGSPIVSGSSLLFYFGYGASEGFSLGKRGQVGVYSKYVEATGVARLRRDGFVGLVPPLDGSSEAAAISGGSGGSGGAGGRMTTRPLVYNGSHLFVNVVLQPGGRLRVSLLPPTEDAPATPPPGRSSRAGAAGAPRVLCGSPRGTGVAVSAALEGPLDSTRVKLEWPTGEDAVAATGEGREQRQRQTLVGQLSGRRVRLQFELQGGELFAFWMSHDPLGASGGYLGGGAFGVTSGVVDRPATR